MTLNLHKIARKWQRIWKTRKIFETDPDNRPKYFITTPYPYVNCLFHIGHAYTYTRVDVYARYKRMQGYNTLFPFAFHATGAPIDTAAKKVQEGEQKQIDTLKLIGFTDEQIPAFKEPIHWIKTFSQEMEKDLKSHGMAIDWRRKFITTDLNPRYDKFIKWQFKTLKKKGLVEQGEHPVVWCPKDQTPVGDHSRSEGEGETPQEMTLIKFKFNDKILPCATFRPETTYGVTNIWINPEIEYVEATVNGEKWIITKECMQKLKDQKYAVEETGRKKGNEITGNAINPITEKEIPLLPASFVSADTGTGIVMSVPAHAPYDYAALKELQDKGQYTDIKPISLITIEGYGEYPAIEICKKLNIQNSKDTKLEEATQEIYKKEFHTGKLNQNTGKYAGKTITEAKQELITEFKQNGNATTMLELINPVICRCLTKCHVKIVDNQWFLKYSDPDWKQQTMKALQSIKLYPEKSRQQFEYVVDWLNDWACTREYGLGTDLPWDKKWKVESLSDSTIYNAFYPMILHLKKIPIGKINDKLFDYVLLGEGNIDDIKADKQIVEQMKTEFNYWYPVDFRSSGKDLIQNHLTFYIFNHTGIFPEKHWPRGIAANGYVTVQKEKMSKSKGNFKTLRDLDKAYSADVVRITILSTGEEMNDVDWDPELGESLTTKLEQWYDFAIKNYAETDEQDKKEIDKWMEHQLNKIIKETTEAMEETLYRTATLKGFFDLQRHLKWYQKRTAGKMNNSVLKTIIEAQTLMLAPFTPHICEEIWQKIGKQTLISQENWPKYDENKINPAIESSEQLMTQVIDDINQVLRLAKVEKPKIIKLFVAEEWKTELLRRIKELNTRDKGIIMKTLMPEFKQEAAAKIIQKTDPAKIQETTNQAEYQNLTDSREFLKNEFNCIIEIIKEQESQEQKAKQAMPGKPAILVE